MRSLIGLDIFATNKLSKHASNRILHKVNFQFVLVLQVFFQAIKTNYVYRLAPHAELFSSIYHSPPRYFLNSKLARI